MDMSLPRRATRLAWTALAVGLLAVGAASEPSSGAGEPRKSPDLGEAVPTPIALSDPDGQELILEELSVRAAAHGMLSLTELELRFRNPHARRMEGRFSCVLPPGATVSRFAKEVNGILMEGEVVERLRANRIYDEILHQMRDPALLEQDQGNRFSARIFPIEPHATVRLVLSYTRLLPIERGVRTYVLPLRGMPRIERFSFRGMFSALPGETLITTADRGPRDGFVRPAAARHSSAEVISISEQSFIPRQDIEIRWRPEQDAPQARLLRAGEFYLAAFRVSGAAVQPARDARPSRRPWIVYVDTSASAAEGERHRIHALEELFSALEPTQPLDVVAFDQQVVPLLRGSAAEISSRIGPALRSRHFLGGTDLGLLLADVADRLARQPGAQVVIATDGVATMGSSDRVKLASAIRALPKATIHALALGSRQDAAFLRALTAGRGRIVEIPFSESLTRNARQAAAALGEPLGASFDVADAGAEWVYPSRLTDVRNDSEVIIVGKLRPAARAAVQLTGGGGTLSVESPETLPFATFEPLLEREAYRIYLEQLAERETAETSAAVRSALATEQVRISVEKRVLIPHTTMLVLETEEDYRRFGLDRRALAAILTIDAGGIARLDRREPRLLAQKPADIREERFELPIPSPMDELDRDLEPVAVSETARRSSDVASSPAPRASIIGRPPIPQPPERKRAQPDWTVPTPPSRSEVERLVAQLRRDPRDRSLYNSVSEGLVALSDWGPLRRIALQWQQFDPENPQVYELLGEAARHLDLPTESARAFGSLVEIAPARPEMLQRAALLLLRSGNGELAESPLRRALELRPDRVNAYRHLALILWQQGRLEQAAHVLEEATRQSFPAWYGDAQRVIREELAYLYRAMLAREPSRRAEILRRAGDFAADLSRRDALRISLAWETDANDVDLHVVDPDRQECFYGNPRTASGLELYQDITQGFGPEVIRASRIRAGKYHVGVKYFSAGPMGVSRGVVVILQDRGGDEPKVQILPFRLLEGGGEIRHLVALAVQ